MIKSYSLKHKRRGEGRERSHCCVCVWVPGQREWPCGFSLIPWLSGAALGPLAGAPVEALDHEINPVSGSFTGLFSTSPPCSVPTEPWGCGLCLRVCSHSSAVLCPSPGRGCVQPPQHCVRGLCQSVGHSGVYVCLWTRVHGVAVLCSIKLSYT